MIIGIGTDIVDIRRIENTIQKYGEKFKKRCFSINEINSDWLINFRHYLLSYDIPFSFKNLILLLAAAKHDIKIFFICIFPIKLTIIV